MRALLAALVLLLPLLSDAAAHTGCPRGDLPTVVIGAGVAGLSAAMALRAHNCSVVLLESRERVGGRLHTFRSGPFEGIEMGGHWVHGGLSNAVTPPVLQFLGLNMRYAGGDSTYEGPWNSLALADSAGRPLTDQQRDDGFVEYEILADRTSDWLDQHMAKDSADISMGEVWQHAGDGALLANLSSEKAGSVRWNLLLNEQDEGAVLGQMSAKAQAADYTDYRGHTGDGLVDGGYQALVDALATAAGGDETIRLGDAVTEVAVEPGTGNHSVLCVRTAAGRNFTTAAVVVAAPLPVLQRGGRGGIRFSPPLPTAKSAAIASIGAGHVTKVLARLRPGSAALNASHYSIGQQPRPALGSKDFVGSYAINDFSDRGLDVIEYFMVDTVQVNGDASSICRVARLANPGSIAISGRVHGGRSAARPRRPKPRAAVRRAGCRAGGDGDELEHRPALRLGVVVSARKWVGAGHGCVRGEAASQRRGQHPLGRRGGVSHAVRHRARGHRLRAARGPRDPWLAGGWRATVAGHSSTRRSARPASTTRRASRRKSKTGGGGARGRQGCGSVTVCRFILRCISFPHKCSTAMCFFCLAPFLFIFMLANPHIHTASAASS